MQRIRSLSVIVLYLHNVMDAEVVLCTEHNELKLNNCARLDVVMYSHVTSEDECKWFQHHMIYCILLKQTQY
jgi:hypothetical protein